MQFGGARVHQPDRVLEAGGQQIAGDNVADAVRLAARADQGDARGLEEALEIADGHGLGGGLVECGLKFANGFLEAGATSKRFEKFYRCAHLIQRRNAKHLQVGQIREGIVLVLLQKRTVMISDKVI